MQSTDSSSSFLAGILPLSLSLSQRQLRIVTLLGTGVLVGTSLIVIIPEGIETMYSAGKTHAHVARGIQPVVASTSYSSLHTNSIPSSHLVPLTAMSEPVEIIVEKTITNRRNDYQQYKDKAAEQAKTDQDQHQPQKGGDDDSTEGHKEGHTRVHAPEEDEKAPAHMEHDEGSSPHAYIGVALILGYILMFLVDHLPEAVSSSQPQYQPMHISLSNLARGPHNSSSLSLNGMTTPVSPAPMTPNPMQPPRKNTSATTIGLVVHSCADGIALGASSAAPSTSLSFVVFLAIMLHKAPAAFGLTSVLLKQGLSKRTARTHLAFFSMAAPAGAFLTWAIVHLLGRARLGGDEGLAWTTGWVLCFSGGTFL
jgi:zinc transporter 9